MNEEWRDIDGYEDLYQVSNMGRVLSLKFNHTENNPKILKPIELLGYLVVNLYKDGKMKSFKIHRLVAKAFIPNPDNLPEVNHKDENKFNNVVDNLEWCTTKYNINYGTAISRSSKTRSLPVEEKRRRKSERNKAYRTKHLEELREYSRVYRERNRDEINRKQRESYERNKRKTGSRSAEA